MDSIIYSYGGYGELIWQMFNGMARLFAHDSDYFTSAAKLSMTIGALWAGTRAMFGANIGIFGKQWFFPSFLAFTLLFSPKDDVLIVDEVAKKQYSVSGVPAGIALLASLPSKFSHYLSEAIEDQLKVADSNKSSHTGLMFGAKMVAKLKETKIQDPILLENTKNFMTQCYMRPWIMGNLLGKKPEAENAPNIAAWLSQPGNQAKHFGIYLKDAKGNTEFKSCPIVTPLILGAIAKESKSDSFLSRLGFGVGVSGDNSTEVANSTLRTGRGALKMLGKVNTSVHEWVKQSMILNAYREGLDDWREGAGHNRLWPHLVSMSATRGLFQQSFGWLTAGEMAGSALPWMQTILFLIIIGSTLVVFPMCLLPGGHEILKIWAKAMIWVHTWPIFFAIINSIGQMILAKMIGSQEDTFGLSKLTQEDFSETLFHTYAGVQMFASMIPIFSWMLISKSGYAFTSMVNSLAPTGISSNLGIAAADGNINMDNVSTGNRTIAQQSYGGSLSLDGVTRMGGVTQQAAFGGESTFIGDKSAGAVDISMSEGQQNAITQQSALEDSYQKSEGVLYEKSVSATDQSGLDVAQHWGSATAVNDRFSKEERASIDESMRKAEKISKEYSQSNVRNDGNQSRLETHARGNIGGVLGKVVGVDVGGGLDKVLSTEDRKGYEFAQKNGWNEEHAKNYAKGLAAVRSGDVSFSSDSGTKAGENYSANFAETERHAENISASKTRSKKYSELASGTSSSGRNVSQSLNDAVLEDIAERNHGGSKAAAAQWAQQNQSAFAQEGRKFIDQKMENISHIGGGIDGSFHQSKNDIKERAPTGMNSAAVQRNREEFGLGGQAKEDHQSKIDQRKNSANNLIGATQKIPESLNDEIRSGKRKMGEDLEMAKKKITAAQDQSHLTRGFVDPNSKSQPSNSKRETPLERAHRLRKEGR